MFNRLFREILNINKFTKKLLNNFVEVGILIKIAK